jgi:hypothetical protein
MQFVFGKIMKKILTEFFSLALFPIMLAINYYTGHFGPIFLLDCIYVVAGAIMGLGIWLILSDYDEKMSAVFAKGFKELSPWKIKLAYVYWLVAGSYFMWQQFFVSFILLTVYIALYKFYIFCLKELNAETASV